MKKKIICRCLNGAPIGIAIGFVITVFISLSVGDGMYYPVVPELAVDFGSEISAVLIQTLCCMVYGAVFAGGSVIWDMERWSLTRMTLTHLAVISLTALPIAWLMRWMEHSPKGVALYIAAFFGIYALIWITQYSVMKKRVKEWNEQIRKNTKE